MMPIRIETAGDKEVAVPAPEAELRLSEVNHRIANNLSLIASLVRMYGADIAKRHVEVSSGEMRDFLCSVAARIDSVGRLHRLLSEKPARTDVDLGGYLRDLCDGLLSCLSREGGFAFTYDFEDDCWITASQVTPLCLVISEIITNAFKHAHPSGVAGQLMVSCLRLNNGQLVIEVRDDGVGLPEGFDPASDGGLGLRLVQLLGRQLNAACHFESSALGLGFRLELPSTGRHVH